ncbi:MAG: hypothetical protein AAF773_22635 [Cyanobacteria bacterium P01_D01_bin.115]
MDVNDTTYSLESVVESDIAQPLLGHSMPFQDWQYSALGLPAALIHCDYRRAQPDG